MNRIIRVTLCIALGCTLTQSTFANSLSLKFAESQIIRMSCFDFLSPSYHFTDNLPAAGQISLNPAGNIFNKSIYTSIPAAVAWLSAIELARASHSGFSAWSPDTFFTNTLIDGTLTLVSHAIAVGHIPYLSRFFEQQPQGFLDSAKRTSMNVILSSAIITSFWVAEKGLTGTDSLRPEHFLVAVGLTGLVYPVLQIFKEELFIRGPRRLEKKYLEALNKRSKSLIQQINTALQKDPSISDSVKLESSQYLLSTAEAYVTSFPFEEFLELRFNALSLKQFGLLGKIKALKKQRTLKLHPAAAALKIQQARRVLLNRMLTLLEGRSLNDYERALFVSTMTEPFSKDRDQIMVLHKILKNHSKTVWKRLLGLSFLDMSISVGFAGGILLYGVNAWMQSGLPLTLSHLLQFIGF